MPIDYKKYPANWKSEIVPAIIKRAGNCCEVCGLENKQIVFAIKLCVKDVARYKLRSIWFRDRRDAMEYAFSFTSGGAPWAANHGTKIINNYLQSLKNKKV